MKLPELPTRYLYQNPDNHPDHLFFLLYNKIIYYINF